MKTPNTTSQRVSKKMIIPTISRSRFYIKTSRSRTTLTNTIITVTPAHTSISIDLVNKSGALATKTALKGTKTIPTKVITATITKKIITLTAITYVITLMVILILFFLLFTYYRKKFNNRKDPSMINGSARRTHNQSLEIFHNESIECNQQTNIDKNETVYDNQTNSFINQCSCNAFNKEYYSLSFKNYLKQQQIKNSENKTILNDMSRNLAINLQQKDDQISIQDSGFNLKIKPQFDQSDIYAIIN